jgi:hypothetical protein
MCDCDCFDRLACVAGFKIGRALARYEGRRGAFNHACLDKPMPNGAYDRIGPKLVAAAVSEPYN